MYEKTLPGISEMMVHPDHDSDGVLIDREKEGASAGRKGRCTGEKHWNHWSAAVREACRKWNMPGYDEQDEEKYHVAI